MNKEYVFIGNAQNKTKDFINQIVKENKELKKQLENTINSYTEEHNLRHNSDLKLDVLKTQQKEYIKYLEDEIKRINPKILDDGELNLRLDDIKYTQYLTYKEILQKYKEIIGVSDENKAKV